MRADIVIVGAGIMGLTMALESKKKFPHLHVLILEKEIEVALHASGRNSGVLHAGFYYSADSLKAKFCREGNFYMKKFCEDESIRINSCGKLVVVKNEAELKVLEELYQRGIKNGVTLSLINEEEVSKINPLVRTYKKAIYSSTSAVVSPREVTLTLKKKLQDLGVEFKFNSEVEHLDIKNKTIKTLQENIHYKYLINCAGMYADKIAAYFGLGLEYVLVPFKGIYLGYDSEIPSKLNLNIYPVPNLLNPFLGVHYTIKSDGSIKIGPTAIPCLSRENYTFWGGIKLKEFLEISYYLGKMLLKNSENMRSLAFQEMLKYNKKIMQSLIQYMAPEVDVTRFTKVLPPGIRPQLITRKDLRFVQDFQFRETENSLHLLNAISPAFTCSFAISKYLVEKIEFKNEF